MKITDLSQPPLVLSAPTQIHAPAENVDKFRSLLTGMKATFVEGKPRLQPEVHGSEKFSVSLAQDTALRLHKAEVAMNRLSDEMKKSNVALEQKVSLDSGYVEGMAHQKFMSAYYFVGMARMSSSADSFSEEVNSLTKGR